MTSVQTIPPWYKQFWPWFIFGLPASVVVACIVTVTIAFKNQDSLVVDSYYKEGRAINRVLERDQAAERLALAADVSIDTLVGEVQVLMAGDVSARPPTLEMQWFHPTDKRQDFSITLKHASDNRYVGQLDGAVNHRWYIQVTAQQPEPWRLKSEVSLGSGAGNESQTTDYQFHLGVSSTRSDNS